VTSPAEGEVSWSADRRFGVVLPTQRSGRTVAILGSVENEASGDAGEAASARTPMVRTYRVFPEETVEARIAIPLSAENARERMPEFALLGPDGQPLELWLDPGAGLVWASTFQLGEFRVVPGRSGAVREIDDRVASIRAAAPNPFVGETVIALEIGDTRPVTLSVHDVSGRRVASLLDHVPLPPGPHTLRWDGSAEGVGSLPAGTYWLRLRAGRGESSERIVLLR
jgi:hypothetical protein